MLRLIKVIVLLGIFFSAPAFTFQARSVQDVFDKIRFCRTWKDLSKELGIRCSEFYSSKSIYLERFSSENSDVVVGKDGTRSIYDRQYYCGDDHFHLRFSYDHTNGNCAYETFIKKNDKQLFALAFDDKGKLVKEVPREIAEDELEQKGELGKADKTIRPNRGCFACHPDVSSAVDDYEKFWPDAYPKIRGDQLVLGHLRLVEVEVVESEGLPLAGALWYLGGLGKSCNQVCRGNRRGYNSRATRTLTGSSSYVVDGDPRDCFTVARKLTRSSVFSSIGAIRRASNDAYEDGIGCVVTNNGSMGMIRSPETTGSAKDPKYHRVCACNS